jgi:hypothetical protein
MKPNIRSYEIAESFDYGEPIEGSLGLLEVSNKKINSCLDKRRFIQGTNSDWCGIFTKVKSVRVCVKYIYAVGFSLEFVVVIGIE